MKTISAEEFRKKYGDQAASKFAQPTGRPSITQVIANSFKAGVDQVKQGVSQSANAKNPLQLFEGSLKMGAGAVNAAFSPLAPVIEPTIGKGIELAGDKISNIPAVQKFADSKAGAVTSRAAEDIANLSTIGAAVVGSKSMMKAAKGLPELAAKTSETVGKKLAPATKYAKNVAGDMKPTSQGMINQLTSKALDLTPGDLKNIVLSTGNEVGTFLADHNLIGENKATTVTNLTKFLDDNYKSVRTELGKAKDTYKPTQVPRYAEALNAIKNKIDKVPGMQEAQLEVKKLLTKKQITLSDVQRVKELIDKHFNLYKVTGDVGEGVAKQGLDNIRKDIRVFLEKEAKAKLKIDIKKLNNNVSTSKSLLDAIEARTPRGITRSNIQIGDLGAFGLGMTFGGPLGGAAALFIKKVIQSPSLQLRLAKFIDSVSDARKAKIKADLEAGKVPSDLKKLIND